MTHKISLTLSEDRRPLFVRPIIGAFDVFPKPYSQKPIAPRQLHITAR